MATSKIERLMNLVIALLSTRQFLTAEKIRDSVAGYNDSANYEAFSRMFERDKNELRDLGVPLETGSGRDGSRPSRGIGFNRNAYELPDVDLTSEESAAVAVAVQLWESPELISAAQSALLKLRAAARPGRLRSQCRPGHRDSGTHSRFGARARQAACSGRPPAEQFIFSTAAH